MFLQDYWDYYNDYYNYYTGVYSFSVFLSWAVFFGIWFGIGLILGYLVYRDAKHSHKRGLPATMWFLIVLLTGIIGVLVYLLMKNAK